MPRHVFLGVAATLTGTAIFLGMRFNETGRISGIDWLASAIVLAVSGLIMTIVFRTFR